jgi:hypothetical protein
MAKWFTAEKPIRAQFFFLCRRASVRRTAVRRLYLVVLLLSLGVAIGVRADTFQLQDGTSITGEIALPATPETLNIKTGPSKYERIGWTNFTQTTLQELVKNPKLTAFVEPYIEVTIEERRQKTAPPNITQPERVNRPPKTSLFAALAGSSVGLVTLLLLYAANIYAGYEVSVIRAYSPALVCGISAIAPIIGPIIFLSMPTKMKSLQAEEEVIEEAQAHAPAPVNPMVPEGVAEGHAAGGLSLAARPEAGPALPETQVFKRGQFTFNRRFIETKFASFFGIARRDADKDMILLIKAARGEFPATRISRIAASDMHVEVRKGNASSEVQIPFVEISEIHLKHKDA